MRVREEYAFMDEASQRGDGRRTLRPDLVRERTNCAGVTMKMSLYRLRLRRCVSP